MHFCFPKKISLCVIYKHFELWGHWKCPHESPSPCNTCVLPMSLGHDIVDFFMLYFICSNTVNLYNDTSLFLSNTVGNLIKQNVNDVNCDKMSDRAF